MSLWVAFLIFVSGTIASRLLAVRAVKDSVWLVINMTLVYLLFFQESLLGSLCLFFIVICHLSLLQVRFFNFIFPLLVICLYRFFPAYAFIGISFVCFRLISAAIEFTNEEIRKPSLIEYLSYCFYFPTYKLGPIGSFKDHLLSCDEEAQRKWNDLQWTQLARISYGIIKCLFFATLISNYYQSLQFDGLKGADSILEVLISGSFLYLKLYLMFSGFNDIAIGVSHFIGFRMKENFNHPILAKNIGDFWSRWHISLTDLLKDLIFYPLNIGLIRKFGKNSKFIVTPLSFLVLFMAISLWHGFTSNFFILGIYYAIGAIIAFYFSSIMMMVWPGYKESKVATSLSILTTQMFIAISFFIFHCDGMTVRAVFNRITGLHL